MKPVQIIALLAGILVVVGILSLVPKLTASGNIIDGAGNLFQLRNQIECSTTIINPALSDVKIASFNCQKIGTCRPVSSSGLPFSLLGFYDEGIVQWNTKDFTDQKTFQLSEFIPPFSTQSSATFKTSICTLDSQVIAIVLVDNKKTDSKTVNL